MKWLALLLCRLLVVGPVLKWLALFITVPTTCSRPSIEMVGFMYVCIYLLLCRLLVVGPVLKWLALFIYVCIYLCMYVFLRVHSLDQTVIYY